MTAEKEIKEAIGRGMHGGRLPNGWDVVDAEIFAIRVALRDAIDQMEQREEQARILIMSDCRSGLQMIHTAMEGRGECRPRENRMIALQEVCNLCK